MPEVTGEGEVPSDLGDPVRTRGVFPDPAGPIDALRGGHNAHRTTA